jgi:hypothetical protein
VLGSKETTFMTNENQNAKETHENRDPISHEPGAHPVGTGVGSAGVGAAATVVGGLVGGPVGAAVGAVVGSVVGGLAGKGVAESINPTAEDSYWHQNYASRPYVEANHTYEHYQPAYRTGYEGYARHAESGRTYEEVEPELQAEYERAHSASGLPWSQARHAARDAWSKLHEERRTGV